MKLLTSVFVSFLASSIFAPVASADDAIKIAFIDPLSGLMAAVGENSLHSFQYVAGHINARGGVLGKKFEIIPFDSKLSPQESLQLFSRAIDQGIRYIVQGSGSSVAGALIEAVNKHNARNPDKAALFLNHGAVDPDFTNSKCSFWHFRFDANSDMKMEALIANLAKNQSTKNVYLFNQDYQYGQQVRRAAREMLARHRPDIKIVGDELHPLARIIDFSPYVSKIKASGADSVITGNWGSDLALLVKAAKASGLNVNFYTYYGELAGTPTAIGQAGAEKVKMVGPAGHQGDMPAATETFYLEFAKKFPKSDFYNFGAKNMLDMVAKAMTDAKSTDPLQVARRLEGMRYEGPYGEVQMRAADHQLIQPLFISTFTKADGKRVKYDSERTGYGFVDEARIEGRATALPTSCQMQRP